MLRRSQAFAELQLEVPRLRRSRSRARSSARDGGDGEGGFLEALDGCGKPGHPIPRKLIFVFFFLFSPVFGGFGGCAVCFLVGFLVVFFPFRFFAGLGGGGGPFSGGPCGTRGVEVNKARPFNGCGSKPMVPFWGRCTIGMFTGGTRF